MIGFTFVVSDNILQFAIIIEQELRISDTNIIFSVVFSRQIMRRCHGQEANYQLLHFVLSTSPLSSGSLVPFSTT